MERVVADRVADLTSFCAGLQRDCETIATDLKLPWNKGPVEGQIEGGDLQIQQLLPPERAVDQNRENGPVAHTAEVRPLPFRGFQQLHQIFSGDEASGQRGSRSSGGSIPG
jgi:hypothetical protein